MSKQHEYDGEDIAHGIEMVTGGDAAATAEVFSEFFANELNGDEQKLLAGSTWLRPNPSNDDLLRIIASGIHSPFSVNEATTELRARVLASPHTQRVIEQQAALWVKEQQEIMLEGSL